jgi:hypothetical protein
MIVVLTAAVGVMLGLFNFSSSEGVRHYPHPALGRNVTATHREPRLFMVAPDAKDASAAKNVEASSAAAPDEQAAKTGKPHRHKAIARQRNYGRPGDWNAPGYAEARNGPQRLFSNW